MALGDPYATVAELEARLSRTDDGTFADVLDAASRDVEQFCHRQFNTDGVATERTYKPLDRWTVFTDDFHTTTGLIVETDDDNDGTFEMTWTSDEFEVGPDGEGFVSGAGGWPFWTLRAVMSRLWSIRRRRSVRVTAQWGWAAVPTGIKEATLAVAEQIAVRSPSSTVRSESIDGYSVTFAATSEAIGSPENLGPFAKAAPYRRHEGFA